MISFQFRQLGFQFLEGRGLVGQEPEGAAAGALLGIDQHNEDRFALGRIGERAASGSAAWAGSRPWPRSASLARFRAI